MNEPDSFVSPGHGLLLSLLGPGTTTTHRLTQGYPPGPLKASTLTLTEHLY